MNLKCLNLDRYGIPEDTEIQLPVFLIAEDLKNRKLINGLASIGCDNCFCRSYLCELIFSLTGFDDPSGERYDLYFDLLDQYCEKVTHENSSPISEAFSIYKILKSNQQRYLS